MPPSGLAVIIGAGPNTGTGIARILSHPSHGNMAVALLARRQESLDSVASNLRKTSPNSVVETFPTDTTPASLSKTFSAIRKHSSFNSLKLKVAVYSIKHSSKKPFLEETRDEFNKSLEAYVGGAMSFAQECIKIFYEHHGEAPLAENGGQKKGTLIFTGTLGAMRSNAEFAVYGAGRAGVRQLAQSLGKEFSPKGIHVVHTIANGSIRDNDGEEQKTGKKMSADAVGHTYLWLANQGPELWTSELDMRPAQEKY
ncbi:MAG: hypothetical protein M1827_000215 [Pycnora praestabilis]|nr:MAG: hypothetical protein M1827_000215 [Pycnora praestabilis]